MQITVKIIECNARTSGVANINGVAVEIDSIAITGSEKQISWADQIARQAIRLVAESAVLKAAPNHLMGADELDALVGKINAEMARLAAKIDGKAASLWIDNREMLPVMTLRAVALA